jgi:peptide/nickel transport system substrate-binding protein
MGSAMEMKHLRHAGTAVAIAATLAIAPMQPASAADSKPLVIARDMDVNSLDPARAFCDTCQIYLSAAYETLLTLDAANKIVPLLAKSWEVNTDQTHFVFHLQEKATFSDGTPLTAKDVKWSFERLKNVKGAASYFMDGIKSIATPDAHTVVVDMGTPNSEFLGILAATYAAVLNSAVAGANGADAGDDAATKDTAENWFLSHSVGSGPYVLASYKPNEELRLARNAKYWGTPASIGDVVIRQVKDSVTQSQLLESGGADIAMQIDPDTSKSIRNPGVVVKTVPSYNFLYIAVSPGAKGNKTKLTPDVREAIAAALDYKGILDVTLGDQGQLIATPIPLGFPGGDGHKLPQQDLAKAQALLARAGLANGFEIDAMFPGMNVYGVDISLLMQKVQQDLAKVKIKVQLQPAPFSVWREHIRGDGIPLTAVYFAPDYYGSGQYIEYFGMKPGTAWANRAGAKTDPSVINPQEAVLYEKALAAGGEAMDKVYFALGEEMIKDRIILPVISPNLILAYRNDIVGVRYSACCNLPLTEISRK